jgi:hypothetical protein
MPTYRIKAMREVTEEGYAEVEADSEEDALDKGDALSPEKFVWERECAEQHWAETAETKLP